MNKIIGIALNDEELKKVKTAAKAKNLAISTFIKSEILTIIDERKRQKAD